MIGKKGRKGKRKKIQVQNIHKENISTEQIKTMTIPCHQLAWLKVIIKVHADNTEDLKTCDETTE